MAVNPMQRKATNSFLLGMLLTLLITGLIIVILIINLINLNEALQEDEAKVTFGYVIAQSVMSGNEITDFDVVPVEMKLDVDSSVLFTTTSFIGSKAKVDLNPGTVVTSDLVYLGDMVANDIRRQEYNIITLPSQVQTGEYVDIRLRLPSGEDYIIVSHKQVTIPEVNYTDSETCVWLELSEIEILTLSCAIVEAYQMNGAKLYATTYVEPGIQEAAFTTYIPSDSVILLIDRDQNVVETAKAELFSRALDTNGDKSDENEIIRKPINSATKNDDAQDNVEDKVTEEIQGLIEERENYLDSLGY